MNLFNVYPLFNINVVKGQGSYIWDDKNQKYLDFYGGHAPIAIGHSHPHYIKRVEEQLHKIGFYSNSVLIPIQEELADKLGKISGYEDYTLFLCNSGAEANENALKLASFHNKKKKIISFTKGFHGRTSLAVAVTDNKSIIAPVNEYADSIILPFNDSEALKKAFAENEICAVIVEGIQGLAGIYPAEEEFVKTIRELCDKKDAVFICDSVQCGYGRSGKFFSTDFYGIKADIYTTAKAMANGFPIGGVVISPKFEAKHGMLGTTFGGNHLACAAALAVLEVYEQENCIANAAKIGSYLLNELKGFSQVLDVRGKGLMIGLDIENAGEVRKKLLFDHFVFTGSASNKNTIRLLPALNITKTEADLFLEKFKLCL